MHGLNGNELAFLLSYLVLAGASLGFAHFSGWIFRRVPGASSKVELPIIEAAYLIGGSRRVLELVLFEMTRDGWLKPNEKGAFQSRFQVSQEGQEKLIDIKQELLNAISVSGLTTPAQILEMKLPALKKIERRLVKNNFLLSEKELERSRWIAMIPFAMITLFAANWVYKNGWSESSSLQMMGLHGITFYFFSRLRSQESRLTDRALEVIGRLTEERDVRVRAAAENRFETNPQYDRLWQMKDLVLFEGLASLSGTVFAGPARMQRVS